MTANRVLLLLAYVLAGRMVLPHAAALPSLGVLLGALFVFGVVRWLNHRADPAGSNRPPDAP